VCAAVQDSYYTNAVMNVCVFYCYVDCFCLDLCSLPEAELPDLVGGESYEWAAIGDLDAFFKRIYRCAAQHTAQERTAQHGAAQRSTAQHVLSKGMLACAACSRWHVCGSSAVPWCGKAAAGRNLSHGTTTELLGASCAHGQQFSCSGAALAAVPLVIPVWLFQRVQPCAQGIWHSSICVAQQVDEYF
jgi:hypothetical protein